MGREPIALASYGVASTATTFISTRAPGTANSVMPIAVHAGHGSEMNSSRTFMKAGR